jgi:hypothetical protein
MRLFVEKNQAKGLLGGVRFQVVGRIELSPDEQKLVQHYNLTNEVLLQKKMVNIWGQPTDVMLNITVKQLLSGDAIKCKDLGEVIAHSASLQSACETLKAYLEVAREFGGQEVYEY